MSSSTRDVTCPDCGGSRLRREARDVMVPAPDVEWLDAGLTVDDLYWTEDQFEKLPIHDMWWPAMGACPEMTRTSSASVMPAAGRAATTPAPSTRRRACRGTARRWAPARSSPPA